MRQLLFKTRRRLFPAPRRCKGVRFIGFAEGALGLGQAFRANLAAAAAAGIPFAIYPFRTGIETRLIEPYMPERYDETRAYEVNIIEVTAHEVPVVFRGLNPHLLNHSYNILVPYWELSAAPKAWRKNLVGIDEIWAPNDFIAKAFAHVFNGPILIVPPAMAESGDTYPGRTYYGMEDRRFYFMFSFDYYSFPSRKNPLGVIEAFHKAFPTGKDDVGLIVKSTRAPELYSELKATIQEAMDRDPRVLVLDQSLAREEMLGLIHACDAYVSLHRSEGFGLGMAEALSFGRIVIGTDYSGCTDFLNEQTGYPVPHSLRPVLPHEYPFPEGQFWAEPDLDAATQIMRHVVANPEEARRRGAAGRSLVLQRYSALPVGLLIRARLSELSNEL
jgi:glycosyltransferase involved in cell wall biosynthesis